ncbi:MAG: hypothetical protein IKI35_07080, partial [Stomatobaculum sp.]|nr:hypothetical protein [Stomatobaculum sp.]
HVLGSAGTTALQNMSVVDAIPIYALTYISVYCLIKMVNGDVDRFFDSLTEEEKKMLSEGKPIGK